jgi:hypothetical protein
MIYDIHKLNFVIFKFCKLSKKQSMLDELEKHVGSMAFLENVSNALKRHDLLLDHLEPLRGI